MYSTGLHPEVSLGRVATPADMIEMCIDLASRLITANVWHSLKMAPQVVTADVEVCIRFSTFRSGEEMRYLR